MKKVAAFTPQDAVDIIVSSARHTWQPIVLDQALKALAAKFPDAAKAELSETLMAAVRKARVPVELRKAA